MGRFSVESIPHNMKTLKFWVVGVSAADEKVLTELGEALRVCHSEYFKEALRLTLLNAGEEKVSSTERLRLARRVAQYAFDHYGFYKRFGNTYTGEVADKDLAKQLKDYDVAMKTGGAISFSVNVKRCNPDFLVGIQCDVSRVAPFSPDPMDEPVWYVTGLKIRKDEGAEVQEKRRWGLIPQTNRSRKNAIARAKKMLATMDAALKVTRVRFVKRMDGKNVRWEAQVVIWIPALETKTEDSVVCGIDIGMNNLAVATIPSKRKVQFFGKKDVSRLWATYDRLDRERKALYLQGKRNAGKLKGDKLSRLSHHINELASRRIVDWCVLNGVTHAAMENLSGIRQTTSDPVWNSRLSRWPYFHLETRLEQKLKEANIVLEKVTAKGNSTTCPACRKTNRDNRDGNQFKCVDCGFVGHADVVGADNAAVKLVDKHAAVAAN